MATQKLSKEEISMLKGGSILRLHDFKEQGKSFREIARVTGHSQNTVRNMFAMATLGNWQKGPVKARSWTNLSPQLIGG